jgi:hypothetical protein
MKWRLCFFLISSLAFGSVKLRPPQLFCLSAIFDASRKSLIGVELKQPTFSPRDVSLSPPRSLHFKAGAKQFLAVSDENRTAILDADKVGEIEASGAISGKILFTTGTTVTVLVRPWVIQEVKLTPGDDAESEAVVLRERNFEPANSADYEAPEFLGYHPRPERIAYFLKGKDKKNSKVVIYQKHHELNQEMLSVELPWYATDGNWRGQYFGVNKTLSRVLVAEVTTHSVELKRFPIKTEGRSSKKQIRHSFQNHDRSADPFFRRLVLSEDGSWAAVGSLLIKNPFKDDSNEVIQPFDAWNK